VDTVKVRKPKVQHHEVWDRTSGDGVKGSPSRGGEGDLVAVGTERMLNLRRDRRVVLDDEDPFGCHGPERTAVSSDQNLGPCRRDDDLRGVELAATLAIGALRTLRGMTLTQPGRSEVRTLLNKVPQLTFYFWIIKIMATTVGETAADFLAVNLRLGLTGTTLIMGALLAAALTFQISSRRYVPALYWVSVVLISIVGTLITDNLVDSYGVSLWTTTIGFSVALAATFAAWYASEGTLSVHTIVTTRREAFYWSAILFTFALGTAAGDLVAESLNLGYWKSALLFGGMIGLVAIGRFKLGMNAVFSFWAAYILTRPLGASIGDFLSQTRADGGLGLGTTGTSALFLLSILGLVGYLTATKKDRELVPVDALF
jgi:uncharacterized membrane-anchored protein